MSASLAALEEDRKQYQEQLDLVNASLSDDPSNAELQSLRVELDEMLAFITESIADAQPKRSLPSAPAPPPPTPAASAQAPPPPPPPTPAASAPAAPPEKWSRENHPAFKKAAQEERERAEREQASAAATAASAAEADSAVTPVVYRVNDTVLAKWVSGDKGFYTARITSVTGSTSQPIYTVKFKSYDTVETLRARDVKPAPGAVGGAGAKRKQDDAGTEEFSGAGQAAATASTPGGGNGIVLTSAPTAYPQAPAAEDGDKPAKKFKKIKANKELEKGKNKWQDFNSKSKVGKAGGKKDSMFRTPEGVHGRVGFTGSGQAMRKDPARSRHIYQANEDND